MLGTVKNSEDPDEMPHNAAFYLGLPLFAKIKTIFKDKKTTSYLFKKFHPLKMQNAQFKTYCINMYGKIHQNPSEYYRVATVRENILENKKNSRSGKSQGISFSVREI